MPNNKPTHDVYIVVESTATQKKPLWKKRGAETGHIRTAKGFGITLDALAIDEKLTMRVPGVTPLSLQLRLFKAVDAGLGSG